MKYFTTGSSFGMAVLTQWNEMRTGIPWHCPVPLALRNAAGPIHGISVMTFAVCLWKQDTSNCRKVTIKVPIPVLGISLNCSLWLVFLLDCWVEIKCINISQPCHRSPDSENSSIAMKQNRNPGSLSQWVGWWWSIVVWPWQQWHGDGHSLCLWEGDGDKMGTSWFCSSDYFFYYAEHFLQ